MLVYLAAFLEQYYSAFNVFGYLTMRAILGALTALVISFVVGPVMIRRLSAYQIGQTVRDDGPESHFVKAGTPTMGGALILVAIGISTLLWANLENRFVWVVLLTTLGFGLIGFVDDYRKLVLKNSKGLSARGKIITQTAVALTAALVLFYTARDPAIEHALLLPFFKNVMVPMGGLYIAFVTFVVVGASNAVNLTDGLDGLAIMPAVLVAGALGVFAYATGNIKFASYLNIPFINGVGEILVFCAAPALAFCGLTPTPPRSSWATSARWRLARRLASWRWWFARKSCWPSWVACSSWKPCRWCCRSRRSS